jgi:excisionase family DNA binding protein
VADFTPPFPPISYRPKEAARLLGIGRSHLYKQMDAGKIPYRKDGAARLIDYEALVAYRNSLPVVAPDETPTGSLLPVDQQKLAIERATLDEQKLKPPARVSKRRPPPSPAEQQQSASEPEPPTEADQPSSPDFAAMVEDRRRLLAANVGPEEARLRAIEFVIGEYRRHYGCSSEQAKAGVLQALAEKA